MLDDWLLKWLGNGWVIHSFIQIYILSYATQRTIRDTGPSGTRSRTVKTDLIGSRRLDFAKLQVLVRGWNADLALAGGRVVAVVAQVPRVLVRVLLAVVTAMITMSRRAHFRVIVRMNRGGTKVTM